MKTEDASQSPRTFDKLKIHDEVEPTLNPPPKRGYVYTPLSSQTGHFRLLKLPSSPRPPILTYDLTEFAIGSCPDYYALSYTWGAPVTNLDAATQARFNQRQESRCNGKHLPIFLNLHDGLDQLSYNYPDAYFWADAICINQDDDVEKAAQVAQMGDVYANAERVVVWLGDDKFYPELEDFVWLQGEKFRERLFEIEKSSRVEILLGQNPLAKFIAFVRHGDPEGLDPGPRWQAYEDFYGRSRWWTRAWVVQEVSLAREIEMYCGGVKLDWEKVRSLWNLVRKHATILETCASPFDRGTEYRMGSHAMAMHALRSICCNGGPDAFMITASGEQALLFGERDRTTPQQRLFGFMDYALTKVRQLGATDPRDKVFCVFGLVNRFLPPGMGLSMPEYKLTPVPSVFYSISYLLAERAPTLSVLSRVEDRALTDLQGPSWVPDYSIANLSGRHIATFPVSTDALSVWKPTLSRRYVVGQKLNLKGTKVDVVADMAPLPDLPSGELADPVYISSVLRLCCHAKPFYYCGQGVMEMLSRTLTLNQSDFDHAPRDGYLSCMQRFLCYFIAEAHVLGMRSDGRKPMVEFVNGRLVENVIHKAMLAMRVDLEKLAEAEPKDWSDVMQMQKELAPALLTPEERTWLWKDSKHDYPPGIVGKVKGSTLDMLTAVHESGALGRRLFLTQRGYLGLGPASLKVGEQVWLLSGGSVPYCLVKTSRCGSDEWGLRGEVYLHGFMDGWDLMQTEGISEELAPIALI
jgi:Heterokaryon incompatibility protein (HET)